MHPPLTQTVSRSDVIRWGCIRRNPRRMLKALFQILKLLAIVVSSGFWQTFCKTEMARLSSKADITEAEAECVRKPSRKIMQGLKNGRPARGERDENLQESP
jgi:hypothetical protein